MALHVTTRVTFAMQKRATVSNTGDWSAQFVLHPQLSGHAAAQFAAKK